jgi:hypothetical protein
MRRWWAWAAASRGGGGRAWGLTRVLRPRSRTPAVGYPARADGGGPPSGGAAHARIGTVRGSAVTRGLAASGLMREMSARRTEGASASLERALAALAYRQYGAVSRAQLRDLVLSDSRVTARVGRGGLVPVHRGVFAVGHSMLAVRGVWMAAVLRRRAARRAQSRRSRRCGSCGAAPPPRSTSPFPAPAAGGDARTCASTAPGASTARPRSTSGSRSPPRHGRSSTSLRP